MSRVQQPSIHKIIFKTPSGKYVSLENPTQAAAWVRLTAEQSGGLGAPKKEATLSIIVGDGGDILAALDSFCNYARTQGVPESQIVLACMSGAGRPRGREVR